MTPDQTMLVRQSWARLQPNSGQVAAMFYKRLFELYPEVKPYFKGDMHQQGEKLMSTINIAVNALDHFEELVPSIRDLGARHAGYGVRDADYDKVADALLWTLEQGLGSSFTPEVKDAWAATYLALATAMQDGAAGRN